ncbi:MAG TPA: hypothetical protein VGE98_07905, partial [Thermoanaerobaculia bacterium]
METPLAAPSVFLSAASAQALELPSLLAVLARLAASDLGRDRLLALAPFTDPAALQAHRGRFEEVGRLLGESALVPDFDVA